MQFLVDTGSDLCIYPKRLVRGHCPQTSLELAAANGTIIKTYGQMRLTLNLGLRRDYPWAFVIADVGKPIIGSEFLSFYGLVVDVQHKRLMDGTTSLFTGGRTSPELARVSSVKVVEGTGKFAELLRRHPQVIRPPGVPQQVRHNTVHFIKTTPGPPVYCPPRRLDPQREVFARKEFTNLVNSGVCRPSDSPWSSAIHMVPKGTDAFRVCGDYRALNSRTIPDRSPLPNVQDLPNRLAGKKFFTKIDLAKAYHQIPVNEDDIPKTAVTTPFGLFEYKMMPFGLRNAGATCQRLSNELSQKSSAVKFNMIDDFLIADEEEEVHEKNVDDFLQLVEDYGLVVNAAKCVYAAREIEFLGYKVTAEGLQPLEEKVKAVREFPEPTTVGELRSFLGMINFYHRFLPTAAVDQAPLHALIAGPKIPKKTPITFGTTEKDAFNRCKETLAASTLLAFPRFECPLSLVTDASDMAMGAVLQQQVDGEWQPLAFFSKKLSSSQANFSAYDRELLAVYKAIRYFRHMLEARDFVVYTDHKPLTAAFKLNRQKCSPRQLQQLDYISQFTTEIRHISGKDNVVADALSRVKLDAVSLPPMDLVALAAAQKKDEELRKLVEGETSLKLVLQPVPGTEISIFCDMSQNRQRPFLPTEFRRAAFDRLHSLSHPGVKASVRLVSQRFVWPKMEKDCRAWARACRKCQQCKVTRHVSTPVGTFPLPPSRFAVLHVDLVGPLPPSKGQRYLLTIVDRFTRWMEVVPLEDITAETVCEKLFSQWICRYGCPTKITTDQGRQFESSMFKLLAKKFGISLSRTTPYHPASNGMVERLHRTLKAALMAVDAENWMDALPAVLLGLRVQYKEDLGASAAELVYGEPLRIPGEFFTPEEDQVTAPDFLRKLTRHFETLRPVPPNHHGTKKIFIFKGLESATHVYERDDTVRGALVPPYKGPYRVLARSEKTITVEKKGKPAEISMDRVKPLFVLEDEPPLPTTPPKPKPAPEPQIQPKKKTILKKSPPAPPKPTVSSDTPTEEPPPIPIVTRSGRKVRFPSKYL